MTNCWRKGRMMKKRYSLLALSLLAVSFFGCRTPNTSSDGKFSLVDSLYIERRSIDSLVKVPYSYLPLVVLPSDLKEGEKIEKKEGQAGLSVEKRGDSIFIEASCDSLQIRVYALEETLKRVKRENGELKEVVKAAPSRLTWFSYGALSGLLFLGIVVFFVKKKN